jgi:hypothetical protein
LLRQEKVTKKKATPVYRPFGVPSLSHKRAGLRNSHDSLRGHVLKQCSPNPTARSRLIEAVHRGQKIKTKKTKPQSSEAGNARLTQTKKKRARSAHKTALAFHSLERRRVAQVSQEISARTV